MQLNDGILCTAIKTSNVPCYVHILCYKLQIFEHCVSLFHRMSSRWQAAGNTKRSLQCVQIIDKSDIIIIRGIATCR